jgi:hypothetical protein
MTPIIINLYNRVLQLRIPPNELQNNKKKSSEKKIAYNKKEKRENIK